MSDKTITGVVLFNGDAYNADDSTTSATYDMPYAPDDHFEFIKGVRKLVQGGSRAAAEAFGRMESAMDIGHAYGQNIVTGWNEAPSLPLSPVYLRVAGIEGAFLLDSCSYAWGPEGMVVSSDLMLLGVVGWYGDSPPDTSWLQLPVPVEGLNEAPAPVPGNGQKANSVPLPTGFDYRNPGWLLAAMPTDTADSFDLWRNDVHLVGPTLQLERLAAYSGPSIRLAEFPYALELEAETASVSSGPTVDALDIVIVDVPATTTSVAAMAPDVITSISIQVPAATIELAAVAPEVALATVLEVPAAALQIAGLAPEQVGPQSVQILPPAAGVTIAALAPNVLIGYTVLVPAPVITVAGLVPSSAGAVPATDPSFASVSLLLHMNGSDNSTTFTDSGPSARTVTRVGDAKITTAQSKYGGAAGYFDGSGDYLSCTIASPIGTGAYTLEGWFRGSDTANWRSLLSVDGITVYWHQGAVVGYGGGLPSSSLRSRQGTFGPEAALAVNTWHHFALVREANGTVHIFANGVKGGLSNGSGDSVTGNTFNASGGNVRVGSNSSNGEVFFGHLDDIRITRSARYTATFTPPVAEFPDA